MKRFNNMKSYAKLALLGSTLALAAGPVAAVDYYLAAKAFTKTLPDTSIVPMWGYVEDTGDGTNAHCYDITGTGSAALRNACVAALPDPVAPGAPGPRLKLENVDENPVNALRIFLTNGLPEPTSIVVTAQEMPYSAADNGPTWNDGSTGPRDLLADPPQRVRSFGREAAANGGRRAYVWNNNRANAFQTWGSFIYHSGTLPQKQVYMGLYGAVTRDRRAEDIAAGLSALAYPGVPYDNEVVLFYSDIDPAFNTAVANGTLTTAIDYHPTWFLINGEPYVDGVTADIPAGLASGPGDTRSDTLIRFFSTAGETHVPVLQGLYMTIHAEDGLQYNWQDSAGVETRTPRVQYSAMLPALKTKDAIIAPENPGRYAVYDGNGYMTNPSDPDVFTVGDEVGGMLRFLSVAESNQAPVAVDDEATTPEDTPVDINVVANDSDPNGDGLTIVSVTQGADGTVSISDPDCCVLYTPNADYNGPDQFTYTITDSMGVTSTATAFVDVTVTPVNDAPVANDDAYATDEDTLLEVAAPGILANDTDVDGNPLTAIVQTGPANGILTVFLGDGSFAYSPSADFNGIDSFTYVANDGTVDSNIATVNITVNPVNDVPVAVDDSATTDYLTLVNIDVLANDTDVDGDTLSISAFDATSTGGGAVSCAATCDYTPATGFYGDDTFTYTASDGNGGEDVATVTVTVNPPPVQLYLSLLGNGTLTALGPNGTDLTYADEDILSWNGLYYDMVLDGSAAGIPGGSDLFAFDIDGANNRILLAFNNPTELPGLGTVDDSDVVAYDTGTGVFSLFFDGSDVGLTTNGERLDAIHLLTSGDLVISTRGGYNVPTPGVANGADEDLLAFTGTFGATTSGTWALYFDGSDEGLNTNNGEDVNALAVDSVGDIYLSTLNNFTVGGGSLSGQDEDVFVCNGPTTGAATACASYSTYFNGTANGLGGVDEVDAIDLP